MGNVVNSNVVNAPHFPNSIQVKIQIFIKFSKIMGTVIRWLTTKTHYAPHIQKQYDLNRKSSFFLMFAVSSVIELINEHLIVDLRMF